MPYFGMQHGLIGSALIRILGEFVFLKNTGDDLLAATGFHFDDDGKPTVRTADLALIVAARTAAAKSDSFCRIAPDLVIDILAPDDRFSDVSEKVMWWLAHGVRAVWIVNPEAQNVVVYAANQSTQWLSAADTLTLVDFLPGFSVAVKDIFA